MAFNKIWSQFIHVFAFPLVKKSYASYEYKIT